MDCGSLPSDAGGNSKPNATRTADQTRDTLHLRSIQDEYSVESGAGPMATGLTVGAIIQNLIASGPIWSAVIPIVSSISNGTIDLISGWRRDRARERFESTFNRLDEIEANLLGQIKDSMALIEACDEIVSRAERRRARGWTWAIALIVMIFTGFQIPESEPLSGGNNLSLPTADALDPIIAVLGGVFAAWFGDILARFTGQRAVEVKVSPPVDEQKDDSHGAQVLPSLDGEMVRYRVAREGAISSLVGVLSGELLKRAAISEAEIHAIRMKEDRTGWQKTRDALSSPFRGIRTYFKGSLP